MTQTDEGKDWLTRAVQDVKTSVKQRAEVLNLTIDRQVKSLLGETETFEKASQKELASCKDGLELGIVAMESFTAYSRELMSKGSPCDITRAASELHARAEELLRTYVTPTDYCAPDVKFVPMNIDELTGSHDFGDRNLIGRVVTSSNDYSDYTVGKSQKQLQWLTWHHYEILLLLLGYYYNRFTTLCPGLPRSVGTRRINHSRFC